MKNEKLQIFLLCAISAFVLVFNIWTGSLASWDEAFYAISSKEILQTGDWLTLYQMGQPLFNKPPLYMWLTAITYKFFGVSEFSTRLWSALFGIGCVMLTYFFARRLFGRRTGLFSALVLLSTSHFIRYAKLGMLDVPLTFFILAALYCFWKAREKGAYFYLCGISIGLALMTKGAAGFLAPILIVLYCLLSGEYRIFLNFRLYLCFIIAGAVALPWHLYEYMLYGRRFINDYFIYHVVERSAQALEGNTGNWYFYIRIIINKFRPWGALAFLSVPYTLWLSLKKDRKNLFIFIWVLFTLLLFTLVKTKLQWYIVPMYPALAISIGVLVCRIVPERLTNAVVAAALIALIFHVPFSHIFEIDYTPDIKALSTQAQKLDKKQPIYIYKSGEWPAVTFYFGMQCRNLEKTEQINELARQEDFACLMDKGAFDKMTAADKSFIFTELGKSGGLILFESKKAQFR